MSASARVPIEPPGAEPLLQPKRRRYSIAEKRRIVEATFDPKTSVARVAREHGVNANQVFSWRRLYQRGRLGDPVAAAVAPTAELLPVTISEPAIGSGPDGAPTGTIQLQVPRGRLRIEGAVDAESLRMVLQYMLA
jgi:transposase